MFKALHERAFSAVYRHVFIKYGQSPLRNSDANCTGAIFCNTSARRSLEFSHFLRRIFVIWGCAVVSSIIVYSQTSCALPVST